MLINIKYKKPYGTRYDCYYNNVKVNKKKDVYLPDSGTILLVERSPFLGRLWWLTAIFNQIIGVIKTGFQDFKHASLKQRTISVNYENILSDELTIEVSDKGQSLALYGVEKFDVDKKTEEENPLIYKHMRYAQGIIFFVPAIALEIFFILWAAGILW